MDELLCKSPEDLWEETSHIGGIGKKVFFEYCRDSGEAYALAIKNVIRYDEEKELKEYGLKLAPQFFAYV